MQNKGSSFGQSSLAENKNISYVIVVGPSGVGKSTFAEKLSTQLNTLQSKDGRNIVSHVINSDAYAKDHSQEPRADVVDLDFDAPEEFKFDEFKGSVVSALNGEQITIKPAAFSSQRGEGNKVIKPTMGSILVCEGIHLLEDKEFVNGASCIINLSASNKTCIDRRTKRDAGALKEGVNVGGIDEGHKANPLFNKVEFDTTARYIRYIQSDIRKNISKPIQGLINEGKKPVFSANVEDFTKSDELVKQVAKFVVDNIKERSENVKFTTNSTDIDAAKTTATATTAAKTTAATADVVNPNYTNKEAMRKSAIKPIVQAAKNVAEIGAEWPKPPGYVKSEILKLNGKSSTNTVSRF